MAAAAETLCETSQSSLAECTTLDEVGVNDDYPRSQRHWQRNLLALTNIIAVLGNNVQGALPPRRGPPKTDGWAQWCLGGGHQRCRPPPSPGARRAAAREHHRAETPSGVGRARAAGRTRDAASHADPRAAQRYDCAHLTGAPPTSSRIHGRSRPVGPQHPIGRATGDLARPAPRPRGGSVDRCDRSRRLVAQQLSAVRRLVARGSLWIRLPSGPRSLSYG